MTALRPRRRRNHARLLALFVPLASSNAAITSTSGNPIGGAPHASVQIGAPESTTIIRQVFVENNHVLNLNGDGIVNVSNLAIFQSLFFSPPGPGLGFCP